MQNCQWKINEINPCNNVADAGQFEIKWLNYEGEIIYIEVLYLCGIHLNFLDEDSMIKLEKVEIDG